MTNKYQGTQTEKNLQTAFAGESQARNKYTYFASVDKKEGFEQISALFTKTADNEKEHAKLWFKELGGLGNTAANLKQAAEGENYEHTIMYPNFAKIAEEEGKKDIARLFTAIGKVEVEHEREYLELKKMLDEEGFFESSNEEVWVCEICGHIHRGKKAPGACPLCKASREYFKREFLG